MDVKERRRKEVKKGYSKGKKNGWTEEEKNEGRMDGWMQER